MFLEQRSGPAKIGFGILDGMGDGFFRERDDRCSY
jgi:hypothetical protein